jgi:hypothetical protein
MASTVKVEQVFVVAEDSIRLIFTSSVAVYGSYYDPTIYTIVDLDGTEQPEVVSVYPVIDKTPIHVTLETRGLRSGKRYSIAIANSSVFDGNGDALTDILEKFLMRRTKVDSGLQGAARRFDKKLGSNIRGTLEAIMINDELIGGDF